ncbi:4Fe-4S binding protein [Clostridium drakei]|uniref:Oxidoreductase n=1 Tax=Clostridium drakei TaxID=332101 RepID=A0A2U8DPJ9_9CLOT|nr:4Fe-4S binding protein [Clostridium drakei]AWI04391.1 oxidoreductase [Clostridium drakei]
MEKAKANTKRCKGCYYCVKACPKEAITVSDEVNLKGYAVIKVDEEKCIACGMCYTVCPDYVFELV